MALKYLSYVDDLSGIMQHTYVSMALTCTRKCYGCFMQPGPGFVNLIFLSFSRLAIFRRALDAQMRKATLDGVGIKSKMEDRDEISEEDEVALWKKGLLGCHSAKSLFRTIYFYNGKLFGLRSKEHRNLRYSNFRVDSQTVTYDESVFKIYHGGLKDLKYKPRVVKHVCCTGKDINHQPCIVNCYAIYMEKIKELAGHVEAFYFKPNPNSEVLKFCQMPVGINTLNKVLPDLCSEAGWSVRHHIA